MAATDSFNSSTKRRPRRRAWSCSASSPRIVSLAFLLATLLPMLAAAEVGEFPTKFGYECKENQCLYTTSESAKYTDAGSCMAECVSSSSSASDPIGSIEDCVELTDSPVMTVTSEPNGTCTDCALAVNTTFNFPKLLTTFGLTAASLQASGCSYKAEIDVDLPLKWTFDADSSNCFFAGHQLGCVHGDNSTTVSLDFTTMEKLLTPPKQPYRLLVDQISTRLDRPGNNQDPTNLKFRFNSVGCLASTTGAQEQAFSVGLNAKSYELKGRFRDLVISASDTSVLSSATVQIGFRSGAILTANDAFLLRVALQAEPLFGELIRTITTAKMTVEDGAQVPLTVVLGVANVSFWIPSSYEDSINNGDVVKLTFSEFQNPPNDSVTIGKLYVSAFRKSTGGPVQMVENTVVDMYQLTKARRELHAAALDIASAVWFGVCFLFSLIIIRWHGLPLTMSTLWTDMVAVTSLFSFATGCGGYLVWTIQPSKAYVYWYSAQYFFNSIMVLSLCFHWSAVLSFKAFKKLTAKSPVVIAYTLTTLAVLGFIIICCIRANEKLVCVFEDESLGCSSAEECAAPLAAVGRQVRDAVRECDMQNFYLAFGTGIIIYTLMLMVLGCMVMRRGRSLMLNEDPAGDSRIRQSLTIFYVIISTTIVLYISAQVIFTAQYISTGTDSSELSDIVWYIFIIWLPQGVPPLLLLFLQWNPSTETKLDHHRHRDLEDIQESMDQSSKEDVFNMTPRSSSSSPTLHYSKLFRASLVDSVLNNDEPGNKLRLIVRLKLPAHFDRACFVSLDFCSTKDSISHNVSLRQISRSAHWKCVGTTEPVGVGGATEPVVANGVSHALFPFVAVLEVPVVGPASNTLLRFLVHASTIGNRRDGIHSHLYDSQGSNATNDSIDSTSGHHSHLQLSYQMTMFQPMLEFVATSQAVLDAAASGQPLNVYPSDEQTHTVLQDALPSLQSEVDALLQGNPRNAELSVQTVMMPGEDPTKEDLSHKNIGNIIRFFQYDSEDGGGGLVVEDLQESVFSNQIPRQLIEVIAVERHEQVEKAREDLHTFLNQKKDKQNRGFYGTLIGQIQDEGDMALAKEWLEARLKKRREYVALTRKNIQYLVNRDKHKQYFKASVEKKSDDLRFVPINLHIQDLLIGPTKAFINEERRRASKEVSTYEFTTVGAPAAHCYKFNKGGILSYQAKLKKMQAKLSEMDLDLSKWPEEIREYDDLQWDLQLRMDACLAQAMAALTSSFVRKVEIAIQNSDVSKGEDMLRQFSTLGYLFHVESLLSTHGKEIGMIEDMAGAIAQLSCVAFVLQDVRDKPSNRFSFRMSRKKELIEEAAIVKVSVSGKNPSSLRDAGGKPRASPIKYVITVQVATTEVELPERLATGGEISVTPLLFTHGINEMQTIANNTERAKTELQDMININNLRPLKQFCEKYCRLVMATQSTSYHGSTRGYKSMNQAPLRMTEEQVTHDFRALETAILDAAQSLVKTKRPEILQRSADLCRELGGGRVTVCKSAKDRTAMSVTLEQVRILHRHHDLPPHRIPATVSVMRSHGVRIENALKNTGKRQFAFNKLQRSLLPEEYRCPDQVGGTGNVS